MSPNSVVVCKSNFGIIIGGEQWPMTATLAIDNGGYCVGLCDRGDSEATFHTRLLDLSTAWHVLQWARRLKRLRNGTLGDVVWLVTRGPGLDPASTQRLRELAADFDDIAMDDLVCDTWHNAMALSEAAIHEEILAGLPENSDEAAFLKRAWGIQLEGMAPPATLPQAYFASKIERAATPPSLLVRSFGRALQFVGVR